MKGINNALHKLILPEWNARPLRAEDKSVQILINA